MKKLKFYIILIIQPLSFCNHRGNSDEYYYYDNSESECWYNCELYDREIYPIISNPTGAVFRRIFRYSAKTAIY